MINRRHFIGGAAAALAGGAMASTVRARGGDASRPANVLIIMADQHTGNCTGYAGHPYVKTPNIDALAKDGVVFDNAYCAYPTCTASRCSMLTGLWPHTHGCNLNVGAPEASPDRGLGPNTVMPESILFEQGYATKHRGRWHAGDQKRHACYQAPDAYRYLTDWYAWIDEKLPAGSLDAPPSDRSLFGRPLYMTDETKAAQDLFREKGWTTAQDITAIGRTAVPYEYQEDTWVAEDCLALLDTYRDKPFMITCSMNPPHAYWMAPDPFYSMYDPREIALPANQTRPAYYKSSTGVRLFDALGEGGVKEYLRCYFALVSQIDHQVGRLVSKLKDIGQYENTLIVYVADHGDMNGAHRHVTKAVTPAMYEEICHVPLIITCPKRLPKGKRVKTMVNGVDLMPTILDYTGQTIPKHVQGETLRPYIEGREDLDRPAYTEGTHPTAAFVGRRIRTQEWRLYWSYQNWSTKGERFERNTPVELYHIAEDPGEERNLADDPKCRAVMKQLDDQLRQHLRDTKDPWLDKMPGLEA